MVEIRSGQVKLRLLNKVITNQEILLEHIAKWIGNYAKTSGKNLLVIGFRGACADALLLNICSKAVEMYGGIFIHAICMYKYSEDLRKLRDIFNGKITNYDASNLEELYLCCHKAAEENGIIVGPIDKTFGLYYRSYGKRAEGSCDIFPLFGLSYHDIIDITNNIFPDQEWSDESIDMYEPSISSGIDFCTEAEKLYGIITSNEVPNKNPRWPYFIGSQKEIIALVHQREKTTRHKKLNKPYVSFCGKEQLVKYNL